MRKDKRKKRPVGIREPKKTFFFLSEGRKSEVIYLEILGRKLKDVFFKIVHTNDKDIMKYINSGKFNLKRYKKEDYNYDEVFLVFDKDKKDEQEFNNFISKIEKEGGKTLWSNPCFEIWYLLHFNFYQNQINCNEVIKKLTVLLKNNSINDTYLKNDEKIAKFFVEFTEGRNKALVNSKKLYQNNKTPSNSNPGTTFFLLFEMLN